MKQLFKQYYWILLLFFWSLPNILFAQNLADSEKIKGINFNNPKEPPLTRQLIEDVKISKANWITYTPKVTLDRYILALMPDSEDGNWAKTIAANIQAIQYAKSVGLKIMLKPHIVLSKRLSKTEIQQINFYKKKTIKDKTGKANWIGDFEPKNEDDWKIWEKNYEDYILKLVTIADTMGVELFCIGSELKQSAIKRSSYWKQLIQKIRQVYSGEITYSASWGGYDKIPFWNELDYIGINIYLPIGNEKNPSVDKTVESWKWYSKRIRKVSNKYHRSVLITAFNYYDTEHSGQKPWQKNLGKDQVNNRAQVNLYEAFFEVFWEERWIAGGFLWEWFSESKKVENISSTPKGGPALDVVRKWYDYEEF